MISHFMLNSLLTKLLVFKVLRRSRDSDEWLKEGRGEISDAHKDILTKYDQLYVL